MGTKVQRTYYLPGFYAMRDLNEEAEGCWSQYYEDNTSGRNLYNGYQLRPTNVYSEYDKEMLKRTMLEHEAIFRKQVYELHRLYRIQKDMMDELKKGPCKRLQVDTLQSNSFSSQIPSEGASRMFQMVHLPEATTSNNREPFTVTDDKKPALNFLNESSVQSGPVSTGKEIAVKDDDMFDCDHKGLPRRMFDLQLPADMYIDCEEEERSAKEAVAESSSVMTVPQDRIQGADSENNVKLALSMGEDPNCRDESWKSYIHTQSGPTTRSLSALNEPARETLLGKTTPKFLVPRTPLAENQGIQLPMRSSTSISGMPTAFLKGRHHNEGTSSTHLHVDHDETSREWLFFNNEAGSGSSKEKFSMPSEQIQLNQKPHDILSLDQNKRETWFKPKLEISGRSLPNSFSDAFSGRSLHNSFSDTYLDYTNAASPLLSSWTKPANGYNHVPLGVPSLQCFNDTTTPNNGNPSDKWQYSGDLRSRVGIDSTSYQNGFPHGFRFDQNSASQLHTQPITFDKTNLGGRSDSNHEGGGPSKSQKDVHLNQTLLNGFRNGFTTQKINESEGKCEDLSGTLSWLRRKPTSNTSSLMELDLSQGYPQLKPACGVINPRYNNRQETEKSINLFNLQALPSSLQVKEITVMRNVASDGQGSKKIFGFPIPERTQHNPAFLSHQEQLLTVATKYNKEDKLKLPNLETQIPPGDLVATSSGTSSRNHVNLNFDLNSTDLSNECEILAVPLEVSAPTVTFKIDLEAPIVLEEEDKPDTFVREAAESIILISSDKCSHLGDISSNPLTPIADNTLHWFAEVVSSNAEGVKETSDDGLDPFELLTLELEETKPEEYWCWSWEGQDQKDDDDDDGKNTIASLLFTKSRRGQARKRRQKRDFQKDVLPGLSSLSRHEVTEDLQTIGALMKASGQSWQAGGTMRRNASKGRVGRRPRSLAVTVEEIQVSLLPPPPQPAVAQPANNTEVEIDGRNMIGWGRTTRRCRRQRFPPVTNVATPLT